MIIFLVLWPYLLTTKLRCLQKNNIGHAKAFCRLVLKAAEADQILKSLAEAKDNLEIKKVKGLTTVF